MDACVTANNFWNGEKCDIRKDQFGNEKTDKDLCGFTNNYWDGEKCDETKNYAGNVKSAEQMCTENDRGVFSSSTRQDWNSCKTTDQFGQCQGGMDIIEVPECAQKQPAFPRTFAEMTDYINKTSKKGVAVREKNEAEGKKKAEEDAKINAEQDSSVQKIESFINEINAFGNTLNLPGSMTVGEGLDKATKQYGNFNKSFVLQTIFDGLKNKNTALVMPVEDKFLSVVSKLIIYPEVPDIDGITGEMVPMGKTWYILFPKKTGRGKSQKSLTLYYADWCPHCKPLFPLWKKLNVPGVTIRMLEQKQNNEFKVQGYPTIVYRDGKTTEMYRGERSRSAIIKYLKNKL
jgi:thiol-disulfide isomerase/thioredoxin